MIIEFKYRDDKGKLCTITKNLDPACLQVNDVYIGHKYYFIRKKELHLKESKIAVWLK